MTPIPIPRDLVPGDVIVDNHGREWPFSEYDNAGDARSLFASFSRNGYRGNPINGFAVRIIRTSSAPNPLIFGASQPAFEPVPEADRGYVELTYDEAYAIWMANAASGWDYGALIRLAHRLGHAGKRTP